MLTRARRVLDGEVGVTSYGPEPPGTPLTPSFAFDKAHCGEFFKLKPLKLHSVRMHFGLSQHQKPNVLTKFPLKREPLRI